MDMSKNSSSSGERNFVSSGARFTEDRASSRIPHCCAHDAALCDLFDRLREFRRCAETRALVQDQFDAGRISERCYQGSEARYELAVNHLLQADKAVRKATS